MKGRAPFRRRGSKILTVRATKGGLIDVLNDAGFDLQVVKTTAYSGGTKRVFFAGQIDGLGSRQIDLVTTVTTGETPEWGVMIDIFEQALNPGC